jgi:type II secretory pathway component GspD/PulD (secretin)
MSTTLFTSCLLSALLLGGSKPKEQPRPTAASARPHAEADKIVQVVYPVADLIVAPPECALGEDQASTAKANKTGQVTAESLIRLIQSTVAPSSWGENGGPGSLQFYPLGLSLVVRQTRAVQEEVADLLAALRRLQDVEVAVEIRLVGVSDSFLERLGVDFDINLTTAETKDAAETASTASGPEGSPLAKLEGTTFLNDKQVRRFLEAAQGDRLIHTMQAPRLTVLNGQTANVEVTQKLHFVTDLKVERHGDQVIVLPREEAFETGTRFTVQPAVSADRRSVLMNLKACLTELDGPAVPTVPVTTHLRVRTDKDGQEHVVPVRQFVQQPSFRTMKVDKSFRVEDGKTAVLCWGTRSAEARTEVTAGPPVLSKVPYVNRLFTTVGYGRESETLLLLLTPRIIVNEEEEQIFLGQSPPLPRP